jgi:MFS family permease
LHGRVQQTARLLRANEQLLMICGSTVLVMAGQGMVAPVLPLYADDFGVTTAQIGLTMTMFGLARMLFNVPMGILADRHGRRPLLVGGPIVVAVGMLGSGLAPTFVMLLLWRFVAGVGSAAYMTGAQIYLIDISEPRNRARHVAVNQGALLLGVSIGPGIGGLIAEVGGLTAPFIVVGLVALVAALYAWLRLPETAGAAADRSLGPTPRNRRAALDFLRTRDFVALAWVSMAVFTVRAGANNTLIPLLADDEFGWGPGQIGVLFSSAAFVGLLLIGPAAWIADRFGRKIAIVPTGLIAAGGIAFVAIAPTAAWLIAGVLLIAVGSGVSGPAPAAYTADIAPPEIRGVAMGMYRTAGDLGIVVAPPLLGWIADHTSIPTALLVNAAFVAASALWFLVAARERPVQVPSRRS